MCSTSRLVRQQNLAGRGPAVTDGRSPTQAHGLNWRKKRSSQLTSCDTYAEVCDYSRPPTSCAASRISSPTVNDDNTPVDDDDDDAETTYSDTDGCNCEAVPWASLLQTQENEKDK